MGEVLNVVAVGEDDAQAQHVRAVGKVHALPYGEAANVYQGLFTHGQEDGITVGHQQVNLPLLE